MIEGADGTLHREEDWGRRQLAHSINKIHKAHYLMMNIECGQEALDELVGAFRFNDAVLRYLVIRRDRAISDMSPMARAREEERVREERLPRPKRPRPGRRPACGRASQGGGKRGSRQNRGKHGSSRSGGDHGSSQGEGDHRSSQGEGAHRSSQGEGAPPLQPKRRRPPLQPKRRQTPINLKRRQAQLRSKRRQAPIKAAIPETPGINRRMKKARRPRRRPRMNREDRHGTVL